MSCLRMYASHANFFSNVSPYFQLARGPLPLREAEFSAAVGILPICVFGNLLRLKNFPAMRP